MKTSACPQNFCKDAAVRRVGECDVSFTLEDMRAEIFLLCDTLMSRTQKGFFFFAQCNTKGTMYQLLAGSDYVRGGDLRFKAAANWDVALS